MTVLGHRRAQKSKVAPLQLSAAYAVCRSISRTSAKNFYYGFLALPRRRRDAICAVYAFMRHSDDLTDDPALPLEQKRDKLARWLESMHRVFAGEATDDPVLLALADTQRRFKIPPELLGQLVYGTAMDLEQNPSLPVGVETPARSAVEVAGAGSTPVAENSNLHTQSSAPKLLYSTFEDLYRYCYYVASVVGLITIRIFGYRDSAAEPLAERLGVAFQLTNIVRDVKEDAGLGRIYLPREDLERFGLSSPNFGNGTDLSLLRPVLEFEASRAREFYAAADDLLPLIEEESRAALWTLVQIYRALLEKIAARNYDVFSERVHLTVPEKLRILAKGLWRRLRS
jgi:15-cis-phytoene synthase